ncbi:MAG: Plug domain-containing protein [Chitinophagaceae bacterium]
MPQNRPTKILRRATILLGLFFFLQTTQAQSLQQYVDNLLKTQQKAPREILYMHFDKPSYLIGDTIWFSVYLLDAYDYMPSMQSGIAYIEFISPSNGMVKRLGLHVVNGRSYAQLPIDDMLSPGNYHIRAYTRWMENFPDSLFFQKDIPIFGGRRNWSMDVHTFRHTSQANRDSIRVQFTLKDATGRRAEDKTVMLNLTNAKGKVLFSKNTATKPDGSLDINFALDKNKRNNQVSLDVLDENKVARVSYPINLETTTDNIDVQFLPESGHLLSGCENNIGFKAVDANGLGTAVQGSIRDSHGNTVSTFASNDKGMGIFSLIPNASEHYTATLTQTGETFSLPNVENTGTIVQVDANSNKDSIIIVIQCSDDMLHQPLLLFGEKKGLIVYGGRLTLKEKENRYAIAKKIFRTGICSLVLQKSNGQLLNERMFFLNLHDQLRIAIAPTGNVLTRDSVPFRISVRDKDGKPVQGLFSLAVTDQQQVAKDTLNDENIRSYFLLSAELRGTVESPGYYFAKDDPTTQKALDALMLTQGFVRYDWDTTKMTIPNEPEFRITGKATSLFGKGLKNAHITLMGKGKQVLIADTVANPQGRFVFQDFPFFDTAAFFIQAKNKKDKSFGVGIKIDRYAFPKVTSYNDKFRFPANVNMDTTMQNRINQYDSYLEKKYGRSSLWDVTVTTKARVDGSFNLNGPGQYDQAITSSDLQQMGDTTLLQILQSRIKSFYVGTCGRSRTRYYKSGANIVRFVFDGVQLDFFYDPETMAGTIDPYLQFVTEYLKYYTAQDIKGIEVMQSARYSSAYIQQFLNSSEQMAYNPVTGCAFTYIEITTYGQQGPFMKRNATTDIYRPQPFSYGRTFYQPRYVDRQLQQGLPDVRSTIYWNPFIVTDKNGEAKLSFYSAGNPTDYLFWLEGMDLEGHFGFGTKVVGVKD